MSPALHVARQAALKAEEARCLAALAVRLLDPGLEERRRFAYSLQLAAVRRLLADLERVRAQGALL